MYYYIIIIEILASRIQVGSMVEKVGSQAGFYPGLAGSRLGSHRKRSIIPVGIPTGIPPGIKTGSRVGLAGSRLGSHPRLAGSRVGSHPRRSIIPVGIPPGIPPIPPGIPPGIKTGSQVGLAGSRLTFLPGLSAKGQKVANDNMKLVYASKLK